MNAGITPYVSYYRYMTIPLTRNSSINQPQVLIYYSSVTGNRECSSIQYSSTGYANTHLNHNECWGYNLCQ